MTEPELADRSIALVRSWIGPDGASRRRTDRAARQLAENREAFRDFSNEGLYELSRFLVEARELVGGLTLIVDRFEADPARFLFGDSQAGFEPQ